MKVLIATDIHVHIIDNKKYLAKQIYHIIHRYADYFDEIVLFCRADFSSTKEELFPIDQLVDKYISFSSFSSLLFGEDYNKLKKAIKDVDLVVGRFHSLSACIAARVSYANNKPFLAEVMGDAWDGYWNHGMLGKLAAPFIYFFTKYYIKNANYALYVTESYLQKKYPCKGRTISASNVELMDSNDDVINEKINRIQNLDKNNIRLLTAANVDVKAKGHEFVIKAIPNLIQRGINAKYFLAGGGDQTYLKKIARKYGVENNIVFLGRLSSSEVMEQMDLCDIYIQPSLQEGLPRSVIEAMSRGCLCCGSKTAGIPELLQDEYIFKRASSKDISNKIIKLLDSNLIEISLENYNHSKAYLSKTLNERRNKFFEEIIKDLTDK